ncbi:MAG: DUF1573 domain-containing protein [Luteibaculaceae bacterium]
MRISNLLSTGSFLAGLFLFTACSEESSVKTSDNTQKTAVEKSASVDPLKQKSSTEVLESASQAQITFDKYEHNFGNILQNSDNKFVFSFTNTGTEPLLIEDAKGSCGCTVPQYTKDPIAPGEKGTLEIVYKPGTQKNQQTKTITVTSNTSPKTTTLRIKANVLEFAS